MEKTNIVIPTRNEAKTLPLLLPKLVKYNVIVSDDSDDDSTKLAAIAGGAIYVEGAGDESPSVRKGIQRANGNGYVVVMDADGTHDPYIIPEMEKKLTEGYDLVIGARGKVDAGLANKIVSKMFNVFANIALGLGVSDSTGRFVAATKDTLLGQCMWSGRGEDCIELIYNCRRSNMKICEVYYTHIARRGEGRTQSVTKLFTSVFVRYMKKVWSLRFS